MTVIVPAHQHFWTNGAYQTSWMERPPYRGDSAFAPIRRSFGRANLAPKLDAIGARATIVVEAADHEAENAAILAYVRA